MSYVSVFLLDPTLAMVLKIQYWVYNQESWNS